MKKGLLALVFAMLSFYSNAWFEDFNFTSDGQTLACLNIQSKIKDRSTDVKYSDIWGVNTIERLIVHVNDSKVLISAYTPSSHDGDYYSPYGGSFDILNNGSSIPYIEFEANKINKSGKKIGITGRLNRFTGDINVGSLYGPCKKIEKLL